MRKQDTPRFLYKFRCLNNNTKAMLTRGELHFEIPPGLNDPFDCRPFYCTDCTEEEFRKAIRQQHPEYSASQIDEARYPPLQSELDYFIARFQERVRQVGVFSASECCDSIVMWSHYAHKHQGICLELDTRTLPEDPEFHQVDYLKERPHVNLFTDWKESHEVIALRKNDDWQYEEEWRMVLADPPSYPDFAEAPEGFIHGVILGALMDDDGRTTVRDWVAQISPRPKLYEASVDDKTYRINIRALPD